MDFQKHSKEQLSKLGSVNASTLIKSYNLMKGELDFFVDYFDMLAGGPKLREQIENGSTAMEIKRGWSKEAEEFMEIRKKYLIYKDFQ